MPSSELVVSNFFAWLILAAAIGGPFATAFVAYNALRQARLAERQFRVAQLPLVKLKFGDVVLTKNGGKNVIKVPTSIVNATNSPLVLHSINSGAAQFGQGRLYLQPQGGLFRLLQDEQVFPIDFSVTIEREALSKSVRNRWPVVTFDVVAVLSVYGIKDTQTTWHSEGLVYFTPGAGYHVELVVPTYPELGKTHRAKERSKKVGKKLVEGVKGWWKA